jgi:Serine carboxypeptidase
MVSASFAIHLAGQSSPLHVVDQPAGTGLSYASTDRYAHGLAEVWGILYMFLPFFSHTIQATEQFVEFLRNFYSVFPEYRTMDVSSLNLTAYPDSSCSPVPTRPT